MSRRPGHVFCGLLLGGIILGLARPSPGVEAWLWLLGPLCAAAAILGRRLKAGGPGS